MRKIVIFLFALCCFATGTANAQENPTPVYGRLEDGTVVLEKTETGEVVSISPAPVGMVAVENAETGEMEFVEVREEAFQPTHPVAELRILQEALRVESQGKLLAVRMDADDPKSRDFASLVGLSEPQINHLQAKYKEIEESLGGQYEKLEKRMENLEMSPEELAVLENDISQFASQGADQCDTIIQETLTPMQLLKAREIDLALPSVITTEDEREGISFSINFDAYAALGLSEEQSKTFDEMQEQWNQEFLKIFDDAKSKLSEKKNIDEEITEKLKQIAQKYKTKIESALTPQQKEKLADLRKEIPEKLAALAAKRETEVAEEDDSWKNSWKPGDPLPESMQHLAQPKDPRFPSKRN